MLPTSGYFRDLLCPFLKSGLCERAHCHYRHDQRYEVSAAKTKTSGSTASRPPVPDYVPTPVSQLKTTIDAKSGDHKTDTATPTITTTSSTAKFHNIYQNIPEYKPTPISQLKKHNIGNYSTSQASAATDKPKKAKSSSSISSSDESTNGALKKSAKAKTPPTVSAVSKNVNKTEPKVSKDVRKASDNQKLDQNKLNAKKTKKAIEMSDDGSGSGDDDLIATLHRISGKRKMSFDDVMAAADDSGLPQPDSGHKKVRIAHQNTHNMPTKTAEKKVLRPTPTQAMQQRYVAQTNAMITSIKNSSNNNTNNNNSNNKSNNVSPQKEMKARVAHKPNTSGSGPEAKKSVDPSAGKKRIAHTPSVTKRPVLLGGVGNKLPLKTRQNCLNKFIDEYLTFCGEEEAFKRGLSSEKSVYDRSKTENIYKVFAVHEVKKIRTQSESSKTGSSPQKPMTADEMKRLGNRVVSHEAILNGKISGTFSIEKRQQRVSVDELSDVQLYQMLEKYVMNESQLVEYGYPRPDPQKRGSALLPKPRANYIKNNYDTRVRTCCRCQKTYNVDDMDMPTRKEDCIYHSGRIWTERYNKSVERKYSCCKNDISSGGCSSNGYHIADGCDRPDYCDKYVRTLPIKPAPQSGYYGIFGLDCEMCYTTHGLELTRVTVVNVKQVTVYETFVKPLNPILDYNSKFSGIKESDLRRVTTTLSDVQLKLQTLFNDKTILIGHSLESDLKALKLIHNTVVDTAQVFPHKRGLPFKRALRTLTAEFLKKIIQDDVDGHDSKEDATAALKLMLWRVQEDLKKFKR